MNADGSQKTDYPETDLPSVSVVTVVYNDAENIEKTLLSVIGQKYPKLEYIVIDGGSTDGTIDIIKKHEKHIDCWITEKDNGIYDAMNKGIDLASGQWINFMNSNDVFYDSKTIIDVFKDHPPDADFIYGGVILRSNGTDAYIGLNRPLDEIWKGMPFCHQALFSKTLLLKQNNFCPSNKVSSDYISIFFHYMDGKTFFHSDKTIAIISEYGASSNFFFKIVERWRFVRKHLNYKVDIYYLSLLFFYLCKNYLPSRMSSFIITKIFELKFVNKARRITTKTLTKKQ